MLSVALLGSFLSPIIGAATAYVMMRINRSYSETKEQRGLREAEERAARAKIDAFERELDSHKQALAQSETTRLQQSLTYEKDFASITAILKDSTEAQKQISALLANVGNLKESHDRHERQFEKIDKKLDNMTEHLLELSQRHAAQKPA